METKYPCRDALLDELTLELLEPLDPERDGDLIREIQNKIDYIRKSGDSVEALRGMPHFQSLSGKRTPYASESHANYMMTNLIVRYNRLISECPGPQMPAPSRNLPSKPSNIPLSRTLTCDTLLSSLRSQLLSLTPEDYVDKIISEIEKGKNEGATLEQMQTRIWAIVIYTPKAHKPSTPMREFRAQLRKIIAIHWEYIVSCPAFNGQGGAKEKVKHNGRSYTVRTGKRGGMYIMVPDDGGKKKKVYVKKK